MKRFLNIALILAALVSPCFIENSGAANAQKSHAAKKHSSSKSRKSSSSSQAIGSFTVNGRTVTLLANGKLKTNDKCLTGTYQILPDGDYALYYQSAPNASCGDYASTDLLIGNDLYNLMEGTECFINSFVYDRESNLVTILEIDDMPTTDELCQEYGFPSNQPPLSYFSKTGTVKWNK